MFETAELGRKIGKKEYEEAVPQLRSDLLRVQNELFYEPLFSVVIVIAGVDGAGKGDTVNILHEWMDPRYLEAHAFGLPSDEEAERPDMWRFFRVLPPKGRIGIFFGSWYTRPILDHTYGSSAPSTFAAELNHINTFEKGLTDDGTLVLKAHRHCKGTVLLDQVHGAWDTFQDEARFGEADPL
jgi:polyphosphate kinase 2 (PPK2 family)